MTGEARGGNDVLTGTMGDRAYGTFVGDAGTTMNDDTRGGNDIINVTQSGVYGAASISGDALIDMRGEARGGNDILIYTIGTEARSGGAFMVGDADYMSDDARGGDDVLIATVDGDPDSTSITMFGDAANMSGSAHGGNDILVGSERGDWLYGDAQIYTPGGDGLITGGRDLLNGGGGNDQLWGGPNNDLFVFDKGSGQDVINDFDQGNKAAGSTAREHDLIDVQSYGFADWAALKNLISDDASGNAVIHLTASDTVTLEGVHAADLRAGDFIV
ncbi:calcium-binding protein [Bradyrhizobium centrosematis]|uniref:calcium-binding protein n=1 Tax=Bradyrhizobium centrosematis TaxID=1300039 RepID=UPI00388EB03B